MMRSSTFIFLLSVSFAGAQTQTSEFFVGVDNDAYIKWANASSYSNSAFLQSTGATDEGVAVHWTLDSKFIHLAVAARATGWVGFGIAESGGMLGSDIVLFEAESNALTDSYVLNVAGAPIPDDCQNWALVSSQSEGGFLIFEAKRLKDTGDPQDRPIKDDSTLDISPHNVIAAWGDTNTVSYHGSNDRVRSTIRFAGQDAGSDLVTFARQVASLSDASFTVRPIDYPVKAVATEYADFCFSSANLTALGVPIDSDLHIIGAQPVVDQGSAKYVHHFLVTASVLDNCGDMKTFNDVAFVWAPGEGPLILPPNVGALLGSQGFKAFNVQIHYNNPSLDTGVLDSSGVEFFYTTNKREFDLGVLQLGDPFLGLLGVKVGNGFYQHTFDCSSDCSSVSLSENVTVLREYLHMHTTGSSMYNAQIRDGKTIHKGSVEFYDFSQAGMYSVIQEPFDIRPGDSFQTSCFYSAGANTTFGLGSADEMCIAYLFYYPRQVVPGSNGFPYTCAVGLGDFFPQCEEVLTSRSLESTSQFNRSFGESTNATCDTSAFASPSIAPTTDKKSTSGARCKLADMMFLAATIVGIAVAF